MVHSSLIVCIKMGMSPTNNRQLYHSLDTQKYCTCWYQWESMLVSMLSYPGMVAWITRVGLMKIKKEKNSHCVILYNARVKILNKSAPFTTKCILATESHRECLINTCINGWRHGIEYTQVQKLSNVLQKCTYVQPSINYFHKTAAGAVLFTGLPPFNLKSVSQYSIPHRR